MIKKIDYRKYLSYDNGNGVLLPANTIEVLKNYQIDYLNCQTLEQLIFNIQNILNTIDDKEAEELEEVLLHLNELHYYHKTNK